MAGEKLFTRDFLLCAFTYFFLIVFFFLFYVGMSTYATERFAAPGWEAGLTASIFIAGDMVARLTVGQHLERLGKRRVVVVSLLLCTGLSALYLVIDSLPLLMGVRFVQGMTYGAISSALTTTVSLVLPPERRSEGMGYFMLSLSLGSAIGPLLCMQLLQADDYTAIFALGTGSIFIAFIIALFIRDVPAAPGGAPDGTHPRGWERFLERSALPIALVGFVLFYSYSSVLTFISAYGTAVGLAGAATWFFVAVAAATLAARLTLGRVADRRGEDAVLLPLFLLFVIGLLMVATARDGVWLLTAGFLIGLLVAMLTAIGQVIAIRHCPPERYGKATSTFHGAMDLAYAVGPVAHGLVIDAWGYRDLYLLMAAIGLLAMVIYIAVHTVPARRARRGC